MSLIKSVNRCCITYAISIGKDTISTIVSLCTYFLQYFTLSLEMSVKMLKKRQVKNFRKDCGGR